MRLFIRRIYIGQSLDGEVGGGCFNGFNRSCTVFLIRRIFSTMSFVFDFGFGSFSGGSAGRRVLSSPIFPQMV